MQVSGAVMLSQLSKVELELQFDGMVRDIFEYLALEFCKLSKVVLKVKFWPFCRVTKYAIKLGGLNDIFTLVVG